MPRILLIIGGGIAAYKSLELIRFMRREGLEVRPILTAGGAEFVSRLSVETLAGETVRQDLFSPDEEAGIGHIGLSRDVDAILVAPATANLLARMRYGLADDLATTVLLAALPETPILVAPAMNPAMWSHPATQENCEVLKQREVDFIGPVCGDMACGEIGAGRLAEPQVILDHVRDCLARTNGLSASAQSLSLFGKHILVTSGATREAIDPVRFISNASSGKQGSAIAAALVRFGAKVTLVSGPADVPPPTGVVLEPVTTAQEMYEACMATLTSDTPPIDAAVCVAAVADWRPKRSLSQKLKKNGKSPPELEFEETPDILQAISQHSFRPRLVVGFAAETSAQDEADLISKGTEKLAKKGCDWILANDVSPNAMPASSSGSNGSIFGADQTRLIKITPSKAEAWPVETKPQAARRLAQSIADELGCA